MPWSPETPNLSDMPMIGDWVIDMVLLTSQATNNAKKHFLGYMFNGRTFTTSIPKKELHLNSKKKPTKIPSKNLYEGKEYTLGSSKLHNVGPGFFESRKKNLKLTYVAERGGSLHPINVQSELEKIANFALLDTRMAVARLELMQSPAAEGAIWDLKSSDFERIQENGHVGSGFIPDMILENLLGNKARAKRTLAIQVRIFGPKLGVLKGMLFRKQGISKIQWPESMQKVGPSKVNGMVHGKQGQN